MFSNINKPAFGTGTATPSFGFGATSTPNQTPFGQSQLFGKTTATTGFGTAAPLFGSTAQPSTGALFSSSSVPSFGTTPQPGFGTGLFGQQQAAGGGNGLFANTSATTFGQQNKTAGFGFGATTTTPLFGQQQSQNFQPSTSSGVFGGTAGFGGTTQIGTVIKFNPVTGTDTMQKSGITHSISTKHHCITCMKEYEAKSLEELRWEDYQCNRRGPQQQNSFGAPPFGAPASTAPSLFGQTEHKPSFGQSTTFGGAGNGFGLTSQPNQQSLFGKPTNTFGAIPTTNTFGGFNTTAPAFGTNTAVKPFGAQPAQNVFGTPTTQPSAFGGGNTFFGQANTQNTSSFFNKPAQTAFNTQQPVFTFGQQTTAQNSLFQPSKTTTGFPSFGQTNLSSNTGFGQQSSLFTQTPQNPFNAFQKPAQPTFGQQLQPGFGTSAQPGTSTFFGTNKPLFGGTTQSNFFTPPNGGFMMPQQQQTVPNQSAGIELQPQQDFHTIVEQMYETFPRRELFDGIEVKNYSNSEATNPTILRKIIEQAPLPMTPSENNSKLLLYSKSRPGSGGNNNSSSKFSLLDNTVSPSTPQNNFVLKSSTGKRLVLRKGVQRTEKDLLEEYKSMSSSGSSKNQSLFKNTVLEDFNRNESPEVIAKSTDNFDIREMSPRSLLLSSPSSNFPAEPNKLEKLSENSAKTISTQTPAKVLTTPKMKKHFPLFSREENDSDTPEEAEYAVSLTKSVDTAESAPSSFLDDKPESNSRSPKGKDNGGKTVRFVDENFETNMSTNTISNLVQHRNKILVLEDTDENIKIPEDGDPNCTSVPPQHKNPCGIILTRPEYYTIPPLDEIHNHINENGACMVKGFTIGRYGYGNVYFPEQMDVSNLNLDEIVHFSFRTVTLYPDDSKKPPVGQGLNRSAQVTLDHVWPRHRVTHEILKVPRDIAAENFIDRLVLLSEKQSAELVDYRPETGSWVFTVPHFSKFYFSETDDEEAVKSLEKMKEFFKTKRELEQLYIDQQKKRDGQEASTSHDNEAQTSTFRGLGGIRYDDTSMRGNTFNQSLSGGTLAFRGTERGKPINTTFLEEESISDDVSSSDIGIVNFSAPISGPATRTMTGVRRRSKGEPPKYYALLNTLHVAPIQKSLLTSRNYMDLELFRGRSCKVGWGPGNTFVTVATPGPGLDLHIINERNNGYMPNTIMRLVCGDLSGRPQSMLLEQHVKVVFEESTVTVGASRVPLITINKDFNALIRHQQIAANLDKERRIDISYYRQVWDLCLALWGPNATTPTEKRELFSKWLEEAAVPYLHADLQLYSVRSSVVVKNLFVYLTGHEVDKAADLAMEERLPRLSALIAQSSENESVRLLINDQLGQWMSANVLNKIDENILKIFMLLGGVPFIGSINVCENMNWKRALAIHLWYICSPGTSLIHAIQAYERGFMTFGYANRPCPEHYEFTNITVYDVLYQIMQLFGSTITPLEKIVNPTSYTEDPLDYRLSWLLLQVFAALRIGTVSEEVTNSIHVSFASQLENLGLWKWSIFVLLFIKDESSKTNAIMSVLDRNLDPDRASNDNLIIEDSLVNDFKIPPEWIHTVLAQKTNLMQNHIETFGHLILKNDWCKAHETAITHLIPEFVSTGQCEKLFNLLKSLTHGKRDILHWHTQAGLVMDFLQLHQKITMIKEYVTEFDVKHFRRDLTGLCCRVRDFPTTSLKQKLAIAELSRFMAIMLKILYSELQPSTLMNIQGATDLINVLVMPPDYKHDELTQYVHQCLQLGEPDNI